jgi:hypothetical protein
MNAPKRWIDSESDSNDFERALLKPALEVDIPPGAEQKVWLGLAGLAAVASVPLAAAAAVGTAEVASAASGASLPATSAAKIALTALLKAFAVGAASGTLLAGGYTAIESKRAANEATRAAAQGTTASVGVTTQIQARAPNAPAVAEPPSPAPPPTSRPVIRGPAPEQPTSPATPSTPAVASFDSVEAADSAKLRASRLREEALVLARARTALRHGDLASAFAALEAARTQFKTGMLGEEREALTIELLAKSGQHAAARQRASAFLRAFPRSAHAERVRAAAE